MSAGHACSTASGTALHNRHSPAAAAALYRVGTHNSLGRGTQRSGQSNHFYSIRRGTDIPSGVTLDTDDPEHIGWLFQKALARAEQFKIPGVTYSMTQGVVKNIIPAIASTNAIIAASCCNEAFKIITGSNPYLSNYMMYSGDEGVYTYTFEHERKGDCPVCGNLAKAIEVDASWTLQTFIDNLGGLAEA